MKRKLFLFLVAFILSATAFPQEVQASQKMAGSSAAFAQVVTPPQQETDHRAEILKAYLVKYNSPLADHADIFIQEADKNNLDWKLVVSIAGVESYYGQMIPAYSYNGWGFGVYGNNVRRFNSWDDGIATVSTALREDYMDQWGAKDVYQIGSFYAADTMWANKVTHFMDELDTFAAAYTNQTLSISL
jgi:hypothetical protein